MKRNVFIAVIILVVVGIVASKVMTNKKEKIRIAKRVEVIAPDIGSTVEVAAAKKDEMGEKVYSMHSVLPRLNYVFTDAEIEQSYEYFKTNGINLRSTIEIWDSPRDVDMSGWNHDMGATSLFTYHELIRTGKKQNPVFWFYKKNAKSKCSYAVDVITKTSSSLKNFQDLAQKNVAIIQSAKKNGPIIREALIEEKVIVGKFNINANYDWLTKALDDGSVDAALNVRREFSDTVIETPEFGRISGEKVSKNKDLKVIQSKSMNVPCEVFFLSANLSEKEQKNIVDVFRRTRDGGDKTSYFLRRLGAFSSIDDISPEQAARINTMLVSYDNSDGRDYSKEVVDLKLR